MPCEELIPSASPLRCVECAGADHGFTNQAFYTFFTQAAAQGWLLLLADDPVA